MWSSRRTLGSAALGIALGMVVLPVCLPVAAAVAEDLGALEVVGQRGQSLDQARRDRYECHNWSVEQTGQAPAVAPAREEARATERGLRRERVDRALAGAAIGGIVGSIFGSGRRHHSSDRVLVGAAAGAAIGAATAEGNERKGSAALEEPSDYLRALTACLEGRGYSVAMPKDRPASR